MKALAISVRGRVQRVGFRRYVLDIAQELGLSGWIVNKPDGSVEIFVQGDGKVIDRFIETIKSPPKPVKIKEFKVYEASVDRELKYFSIKPGELWEEFNEGLGAMQNIFIEYWDEFGGFADRTDKNFIMLSNKFDEGFNKLSNKFDEGFNKLSDKMDEGFNKLSDKLDDVADRLSDKMDEGFNKLSDKLDDVAYKLSSKFDEGFNKLSNKLDDDFKIILDKYGEISKRLTQILETLIKESRETREILLENIKLLREAIEKMK